MKTIATIIFLVAAALHAPAADTLNETLQKGLFEEEANHNLDAAIKAYQSVIQQTEEQRKLAATAIFRLGECYRKLGKTNEAVAQYERIVREFSEQITLANLSRQNLRGLGVSVLAQESLPPAADRSFSLPPATRARMKELLQEEIQIAEKMLAEQRKRIEVGTAAPEEQFRFQKEVAALKRQLLAVDGLTTPEVRRQWRDLLLQEIDFAQKAVDIEQKKLANGRALPGEVSRLQREVLAAKRELVTFDSSPPEASQGQSAPAPATDEENAELQRIKAIIKDSPDLINAREASNQRTRLHKAAMAGQITVAKFLLENGADVDAVDSDRSRTPLHYAAANGHKALVELLLANHAAVSGKQGGVTPLHLAAENGHKLVAFVLCQHKANVNARDYNGWTPLHYAVRNGHKAVAEVLFPPADLNAATTGKSNPFEAGSTPLHIAVWQGHFAMAEWLLADEAEINLKGKYAAKVNAKDKNGETPLHQAARHGSSALMQLLLAKKADPNARQNSGSTPLIAASDTSHHEAAALLLKAGADVNAQTDNAYNALAAAIYRDSEEMLKVLLTAKPRLDQQFDGNTPLQRAVTKKSDQMVERLLEAGANPNVVYTADRYGNTPLHWAASMRLKKIAELLVARKADVNAQNTIGETPFDLVKIDPNRRRPVTEETVMMAIGDLLRKAGANEDLQRLSFIGITRKDRGYSHQWFYKGANNYNRFTLLELISNFFANKARRPDVYFTFPFPDLANVQINRLKPKGGSENIRVNVEEILKSDDCSKDLRLEWGDVVDVPEFDHNINDTWAGLDQNVRSALKKCLERKVQIIVKGQTTKATLRPKFWLPTGRDEEETIRVSEGIVLPDFRLREVLYGAKVLLTSSDVTRVKVNRKDPETGQSVEMTFNLDQVQPNTDLWLRDGDLIEVPER